MSQISLTVSPGRIAVMAVIAAACLISLIGFGIRSSFGLYLEPITTERGWSRETFALALAIQNLLWGMGVPVAGAIADRFGTAKVVALGAVVYAAGVAGMALSESALTLYLTGGLFVGLGVAFASFSLVLAAIARVIGPERRSLDAMFGGGSTRHFEDFVPAHHERDRDIGASCAEDWIPAEDAGMTGGVTV